MRVGLQVAGWLVLSFAAGACSTSPSDSGTTTSGSGSSGGTSGSSSSGSGSSSGGSSGGSTTSGGGSTGGTSGSSGSGTSSGGTSGGGSLMLPAGDCYTFATQTAQPYTTSCGDLMALAGAMVDLSNGAGSSQLCLLPGSYASLSVVPSSYASCAWTSYIEGGSSLANQGVIILDSTGTHHHRMWIASNALPNLLFSFAPID